MKSTSLVPSLVLSALALSGGGCKTIVRENIISSVNTGVGITLAENPQTQLYEVKAGFIRSQFYSVPTGKAIEQPLFDNEGKPVAGTGVSSIRPDLTPEIVSGIRAKSGAEHLVLGMDIAENFAIGAAAVNSSAATAMYVSQAKDSASAKAAGDAAVRAQGEVKANEREAIAELQSDLAGQIEKTTQLDEAGKQARIAGLFTGADLAKFNAKKDDASTRRTMLTDALEGEGGAHQKALKRFKAKFPQETPVKG